jgi:hypothetical protein
MKKYILALVLPLLISACAGQRLVMNTDKINNKTVTFNNKDNNIKFTEKTIGAELLNGTASWLAGPVYSAQLNDGTAPVKSEKQMVVSKYSPTEKILLGVRENITKTLNWKPASQSADYNVTLNNDGWGIKNHPVLVTKYSIFYKSSLDIVENSHIEGKNPPSASFRCSYQSDSEYSYDDVFENDGDAVKRVMSQATSKCIEEYIKQIQDRISKDSEHK